jgi:hypothetical protein
MNCLTVRERFPEHALGTLPEGDRTLVDEHLAWCAACRKEAGELERAAATLAYAAAPLDPPADLEEKVVRAIRGAAAERRRGAPPRRRRAAAAGLLAAVIALSGLGWGAVMAGRADRIRDQMAATRLRQATAQRNFATVLKELEGADPANIVEIADLTSPRKAASGQALVLLSPTTDDLVFVVVSGLTGLSDGQFPLQVRLVSSDAGQLVAGTIKALDTGGGGGLYRFFVEDLQAFDGIVVRGAHGKILLHGSLGVHQPAP